MLLMKEVVRGSLLTQSIPTRPYTDPQMEGWMDDDVGTHTLLNAFKAYSSLLHRFDINVHSESPLFSSVNVINDFFKLKEPF